MKSKKVLIAIFILIVTLLIGTVKVQAASAGIEASKKQVEVGDEVTITAKFTAAAWNIKVSGNGISGASYAAQTSDLSEQANEKTFKLDTSKAGTYTVTISGDITDSNGETKDVSQSCTIIVKEKTVTPPPQQEPEPEQEPQPEQQPETPTTKELEFTSIANKTMYIETTTNFRSEYKINTSNIIAKLSAGTEVTQVGISKTQSEGYTWSKIIYNGQTGYVINGNLTPTKPEEPVEEPKTEEPTEEPEEKPQEEPAPVDTTDETTETKDGLKNLEIEGVTLTPEFTPNVYEYRIILKQDINELTINAIPVLENAKVTIAGNTNLKEGENLITIIVYNAENETATYQITVNKNTLDLSDTDNLLKIGTQSAKRNLILFVAILTVAIIALVVVMILKRKNEEEYEEDFDINSEESLEFTENEQIVDNEEENIENETTEEEVDQIENRRPRREKRKGKHF